MRSNQLPNLFRKFRNVFLNMFPIAPHFVKHALPNIGLLNRIDEVNKCDVLVSMFVLRNFIFRSLQVS
jgi:hypothetical protein